jgi:hypothetical protein
MTNYVIGLLIPIKNYNGFSGIKSLGEHLKSLASSFKWPVLYLAIKLGLSM